MAEVRRGFFARCEVALRALGRWSLFLPRAFDRMADWCAERAR